MADAGSQAGQRARDGSDWLDQSRLVITAGMRLRRAQLERAILGHVAEWVPELALGGDFERRARARAVIGTIVDLCLDAMERELGQGRKLQLPPVALESTRVAARDGLSVGLLLRALQAGHQPFIGLLIAEAKKLPHSTIVRAHLREAYGCLPVELAALVDREYHAEQQRLLRLSGAIVDSQGAGRKSGTPGSLTAAEGRVLKLLREGHGDKQIAETLCTSPNTVHAHLKSIFRKLQVHSRQELVDGSRRGEGSDSMQMRAGIPKARTSNP